MFTTWFMEQSPSEYLTYLEACTLCYFEVFFFSPLSRRIVRYYYLRDFKALSRVQLKWVELILIRCGLEAKYLRFKVVSCHPHKTPSLFFNKFYSAI